MYGKTVRRRRALLIGLVVLSLILLTAYFGESPGGGLHAIQRGFLTVVSPIQDGANKALKPVRGVFGWFGEMANAKSKLEEVRKERDRLLKERVAEQSRSQTYSELEGIYHLEQRAKLSEYKKVSAEVVAQPSSVWYSTVVINKGSSEGIAMYDAVYNDEGLVGEVTQVAPGAARVSLIIDSEVEVSAAISGTRDYGLVQPKVGNPKDLLLQYLPSNAEVQPGQLIVTSGSVAGAKFQSLFPAGIPIGTVTSVNEESTLKSVNVRPAAELQRLGVVEVATSVPGSQAARVAAGIASLPSGKRSASSEEGTAPGGGVAQAGGGG